jgi:cystathionine beta-lyase/cystathionine gamma-synthase
MWCDTEGADPGWPVPSGASTDAVHALRQVEGTSQFPVPPLVLNAASHLESVADAMSQLRDDERDNYAYRRYANPTVRALEQAWAQVEGASYTVAFQSGMAACYALFQTLLEPGDHAVTQTSVYHEISEQLQVLAASRNVSLSFVAGSDPGSFRRALRPNTKLVFVESPTNPGLVDVDIHELADACRHNGTRLVVDNTLLTWAIQRPLGLGADVAVYSTTKSVNGHGDAMGGMVAVNDRGLVSRLRDFRTSTGSIMDPFAAWLTSRGMRSLPLRLERQHRNAIAIASQICQRSVRYPVRLASDTEFAAVNGVSASAGILCLILPSVTHGTRFIEAVRLMRVATTFGNLESLVYHYGTFMAESHDLAAMGIPLGLVRISAGIEDPEDLVSDVEQALRVVDLCPGEAGAWPAA